MAAMPSKAPASVHGYWPFIDGLRAVSIIAVVAYHAGVPGVKSGFIGVDVFFVISGFLIINQIIAGLETKAFSFRGFWARRVLRILPAYLLVVGACLLIAQFVLVTPAEFEEFGREAQYSALMVVNYYFRASKGYFDISADLKPLLHLWSLSVEEQFYLAAPLALFVLWRLGRRPGSSRSMLWTIALAVVVAVSFIACVSGDGGRNQAFFLMPFRAWEFALGGLVAMAVPLARRSLPGVAVDALAVGGFVLVLIAAISLGDVRYPSFFAAIPVVGACLIILAGIARPRNPVARLLAIRPLVWLGLVSYAWYLWHWPLLSFGTIHNFGEQLAAWRWGAIGLSLVLAAATYHWLEAPIRRWRSQKRPRPGWGTVAIGMTAAICASLVGASYVRFIAPAVERQLAAEGLGAAADWSFLRDPCAIRADGTLAAKCLKTNREGRLGVLIGNSHARMIYRAIDRASEKAGQQLIAFIRIACVPFLASEALPARLLKPKCNGFYSAGVDALSALPLGPAFAIFSARWTTKDHLEAKIGADRESALGTVGLQDPAPEGLLLFMALGVAGFVQEAQSWQTGRILLIGPVPEFRRPAAACLARAHHRGLKPGVCATSRKRTEKRRERAMVTLNYVASQFTDVRVLDPLPMFCGKQRCLAYDKGGILFTDGDHLSLYGADRLVEFFADDFAWAMGTTPP